MIRYFLLCIMLCSLLGCGSGNEEPKPESEMTIQDFVELFNPVASAFTVSSVKLASPVSDSFPISKTLVQKFIPDSIFVKDFGKKATLKFYSLGSKTDNSKNIYLFVKAASAYKKFAYILVFDKKYTYKAGITVANTPLPAKNLIESGLDRKFTITINNQKINSDGQIFFTKNIYAYDNEGYFTLILRESNEMLADQEVYNPIDSLSRKNKFSGDYQKNKKNFLSVRDGSKPKKLLFFLHIETDNGRCSGEIKGEGELIQPNKLVYSSAGDPCSIEFTFNGNQVIFQELKGCGNYRGVKCFFEGNYARIKGKK